MMRLQHLEDVWEAPHQGAEAPRLHALPHLLPHTGRQPAHVVSRALGQAEQRVHGPVVVDLDEARSPTRSGHHFSPRRFIAVKVMPIGPRNRWT